MDPIPLKLCALEPSPNMRPRRAGWRINGCVTKKRRVDGLTVEVDTKDKARSAR
jgi:hypothetical protein